MATPSMRRILLFQFAIFFASLFATVSRADDAARLAFFESKIRPVLVEHCYECHSTDSKPVQGGLRLDAAEPFRRGGDSGNPIKDASGGSLLIDALKYESLEMPPNRRLPSHVIRDFEKWVADGAIDPRKDEAKESHGPSMKQRITQARSQWAFQPPRRHPLPDVSNAKWSDANWADHWIDRFVQSKREASQLRPAADAPKTTIARRLFFDLTGLPPTPSELTRYLNDASPDAYERLVDRLLASPGFGEHWGRMWLDVARYADSNGGDFNATFHEAWRYRNYVVRAFNSDKPFDEFTREQLAGDLMASDDEQQIAERLVASGFLMLGPKMLSERDKEKLRMDVVDEQVDTVGRTFLGLTLGCARCHDHKFDPIATSDYYALAGIFRSTKTLDGEIQKYVSNWTRRPLPTTQAKRDQVTVHAKALKRLTAQIAEAKKTAQATAKKLSEAKSNSTSRRYVVDDADAKKTGRWVASTRMPPYFGNGYVHDEDKGKGECSIQFQMKLPVDGEYEVRVAYNGPGRRAKAAPVVIQHVDGETEVKLNQEKKPKHAPFHPVGVFKFQAASPAIVTIHNRGTEGFVIADAVEFVPQMKLPKVQTTEPEMLALEAALTAATEQDANAKALLAKLEKEKKQLDARKPPPLPRALAPQEAGDVGDCRICIRGEHRNLGEATPRRFLQVAVIDDSPKVPVDQSGRLQLADWITRREHPLTARVIANRIWKRMLGEGIVRSVDNFGRLGEAPSHPQLLDQLAVELMDHDWSVKHLVRQVALSRTYRLGNESNVQNALADPENRLLWRAHRKTANAESIRDTILLVSGQLDRAAGQSPVGGLGTLVTQNRPDDKGYQGNASTRRTLYTPIIRNELPPMLAVFDFADPDFVVGRRSTTTTPAQSLLMLNSPFVRDAAVKTSQQFASNESPKAGVAGLYAALLSRTPTGGELRNALEYLASAETYPSATEDDKERAARRREAWTQLTHAMLASTEFRMID